MSTCFRRSRVLHGHLFPSRLDLQLKNLTSLIFERLRSLLCVLYILFRCRGVPLHAIVSDFTSKLTENDRSISRFIRELSQR